MMIETKNHSFQSLTEKLAASDWTLLDERTLFITKWQWPYDEALEFQKNAVEFVKENKRLKVYIFTSHPNCFTVGRGLQKGKDPKLKNLVDFSDEDKAKLDFPLFQIRRGGGLTFHTPGQWIFYPIVNLNSREFTLPKVIDGILETTEKVLSEVFKLEGLAIRKDFLGLWCQTKKLASVGIALDRYVTYHGMALNLLPNAEMIANLSRINPCGLSGLVYSSVNDFIESPIDKDELRDRFHQSFIKNYQF